MKWSAYSAQGHSQGRSPGVPVTLSPLCKPFFMQKILNIQVVKTGKYPLFDTVTLLWKLWLCLLMLVSVKVHILDIIFFQFWWCRLGLLRGFVPQFSPWWDIPYCLQQSSFMTKSSRRCFREIWLFYPVERLSCEKEIYKLESGIKLTILLYYFLWSSFYSLYW